MRTMKVAAAVAAVLAVLGCQNDGDVDHGAEFTDEQTEVTVQRGEVFSLVVRSNPSVGDDWSIRTQPDPLVATAADEDEVADKPGQSGTGYTQYFVFTAREPGTTRIELFNCYRCENGTPTHEESLRESRAVAFTVTVR